MTGSGYVSGDFDDDEMGMTGKAMEHELLPSMIVFENDIDELHN
jgi:hypothetical protein